VKESEACPDPDCAEKVMKRGLTLQATAGVLACTEAR